MRPVIAANDGAIGPVWAADPALIEPLPNLDGLVRQGDSLWDPSRLLELLHRMGLDLEGERLVVYGGGG